METAALRGKLNTEFLFQAIQSQKENLITTVKVPTGNLKNTSAHYCGCSIKIQQDVWNVLGVALIIQSRMSNRNPNCNSKPFSQNIQSRILQEHKLKCTLLPLCFSLQLHCQKKCHFYATNLVYIINLAKSQNNVTVKRLIFTV